MTVVAQNKHGKKQYIDNGWPVDDEGGHQHAVSEFAASVPGALSPFGDVTFPLPAENLSFVQAEPGSPEYKYLHERRAALGHALGELPRHPPHQPLGRGAPRVRAEHQREQPA